MPLTIIAYLWRSLEARDRHQKCCDGQIILIKYALSSDDESHTSGTLLPLRPKWSAADKMSPRTIYRAFGASCEWSETHFSREAWWGRFVHSCPPRASLLIASSYFLFFFYTISISQVFTMRNTCRKRWWKAPSVCSAPPLCCCLAVRLAHSKDFGLFFCCH